MSASAEEVCRPGYINDDKQHVLISIRNPSLTSQYPRPDMVQVAITIENAKALQMELAAFLERHESARMSEGEIRFTEEEWRSATNLAVKLLTALGPQQSGCCEKCDPPRILSPNYPMKHELAKMLFRAASA
jgi:hypothetical protein